MYSADLCIADLHVRIDCKVPACSEPIAALTALFERGSESGTGRPELCLSVEPCAGAASLLCNGEAVWQGSEPGEVVAAFEWAFYSRCISALYPQFLSLHAASITWQRRAVSFAGVSGAGKSSLCTAALLDGAGYCSDEYSLLAEDGCITPFPRPLQWGGESHPAFSLGRMRQSGLFDEGGYAFTSHDGQPVRSLLWLPRQLATQAGRLKLLVLPRFEATIGGVQATPVARSQAIMELASEMHHKLPVTERLRELHRRIPDDVHMLRLEFSDVHAAWRHIRDILQETT